MPCRGTTDAMFTARQLQEIYLGTKRKWNSVFVDLEISFDRVPREKIQFVMRKSVVVEWLVCVVMAINEGSNTSATVDRVESDESEVSTVLGFTKDLNQGHFVHHGAGGTVTGVQDRLTLGVLAAIC